MKVAQLGFGYWGNALAKFHQSYDASVELTQICDVREDRMLAARAQYPGLKCHDQPETVFRSDEDVVLIATPPESHFDLAKKALLAGKHAFVEKPLTMNLREAYELIELADKKNLVLFADHLLMYSEPVRYLKSCIERGDLGAILYINSRRINLGLFQHKVDVIWDLAIHDIAVIDYLIGFEIERVSVFRKRHPEFPNDVLANINIDLKCGTTVNLNVSWLSPVKVRQMIIGGTDKMVVYDDTQANKIQIYDHGVIIRDNLESDALYKKMVQYKIGDITTPELPRSDTLRNAFDHFYDCVRTGKEPLTGKQSIINTIQALEIISKV